MPPPPWMVAPPYYMYAPPPPRVWSVFVVPLIALVAGSLASAGILLVGASGLGIDAPIEDRLMMVLEQPEWFVAIMFAAQVPIGLSAVFAAWLSRVKFADRLLLRRGGFRWLDTAVLVPSAAAFGIFFTCGLSLLTRGHEDLGGPLEQITRVIMGAQGAERLAMVVVIGLLPGLCEELLFRGYMQSRLTQRMGAVAGIMISAVVFGAFHLNLPQGIFAITIGMFIGFAVDKTQSLYTGMLMHAGNNVLAVLAGPAISHLAEGSVPRTLLIMAVSLVVMLLGVLHTARMRRSAPPVSPVAAPMYIPLPMMPAPLAMPPMTMPATPPVVEPNPYQSNLGRA